MSLKIRLQRHGKKKQAFYHIVVADSRSPRDGKYVERLGTFKPKDDHDGVTLDNERTLMWLEKGAAPTDTCRNLLSERGLMFKKHLNRGVRKGLFNQEQAAEKYTKWEADKQKTVTDKRDKKASTAKEAYQQRMAAEKASKEAKAKAVAAKKAAALEAAQAPAATEAPAENAAPEAAPQE
jgi:small subunit ribosomal protein S16